MFQPNAAFRHSQVGRQEDLVDDVMTPLLFGKSVRTMFAVPKAGCDS
jgi:hypothetical protein